MNMIAVSGPSDSERLLRLLQIMTTKKYDHKCLAFSENEQVGSSTAMVGGEMWKAKYQRLCGMVLGSTFVF